MRRKILSTAAALALGVAATIALWPGISCAAPAQKELAPVPNAEQLQAHLGQVQRWAGSLKGLKVEQARKLFGQMRPKESTWSFEGKDQPVLTYEFPGYDLELYCLPDRVLMVSIDLDVE
jgi:hypothetical protein